MEHSQQSSHQEAAAQTNRASHTASNAADSPSRLHFDLRSLFLMVGFLALAAAALAWKGRSTPSAMFVVAVSLCGVVATMSRSRGFANVLIVIICLWLAVVIVALTVTSLAG